MGWIPTEDVWFSYLRIDKRAGKLVHDLAISVNGTDPSWKDAGYVLPPVGTPSDESITGTVLLTIAVTLIVGMMLRRKVRVAAR